MTVARPLRALIIAAVILWCFFLYQMFKPVPEFHGPGDRYINFERDPNLDRESMRPTPRPSRAIAANPGPSIQLPVNQKASSCAHPNDMLLMPRTRTVSRPPSWPSYGTRKSTTWSSP